MYCFQKKDGTIKKGYKETLKYIVTSRIRHSKITRANTEEVVDEYDCYGTIPKKFIEPNKESVIKKLMKFVWNLVANIKFGTVMMIFKLNLTVITLSLC